MRLIEVYKSIKESRLESPRQNDIENILIKWKDKLKELNIDVDEEIGQGSKGTAFAVLQNQQVLKVTVDNTEANAAKVLVNKKLKNVVNFYKVFQFDQTGYYGILQERLDAWKTRSNASFFLEILDDDVFKDIYKKYKSDRDDGSLEREMASYFSEKTLNKDISDASIKEAEMGVIGIVNGLQELNKYGIGYDDIWAPNIMKRGKDYVLIDLGYSQSAHMPIDEI